MKKIEGYQCDNCKGIHGTEQGALDCEAHHKFRKDNAQITGMRFRNKDGTYGFDRGMAQEVPTHVMIKFSDRHGDFGLFVLEHYGYKGL